MANLTSLTSLAILYRTRNFLNKENNIYPYVEGTSFVDFLTTYGNPSDAFYLSGWNPENRSLRVNYNISYFKATTYGGVTPPSYRDREPFTYLIIDNATKTENDSGIHRNRYCYFITDAIEINPNVTQLTLERDYLSESTYGSRHVTALSDLITRTNINRQHYNRINSGSMKNYIIEDDFYDYSFNAPDFSTDKLFYNYEEPFEYFNLNAYKRTEAFLDDAGITKKNLSNYSPAELSSIMTSATKWLIITSSNPLDTGIVNGLLYNEEDTRYTPSHYIERYAQSIINQSRVGNSNLGQFVYAIPFFIKNSYFQVPNRITNIKINYKAHYRINRTNVYFNLVGRPISFDFQGDTNIIDISWFLNIMQNGVMAQYVKSVNIVDSLPIKWKVQATLDTSVYPDYIITANIVFEDDCDFYTSTSQTSGSDYSSRTGLRAFNNAINYAENKSKVILTIPTYRENMMTPTLPSISPLAPNSPFRLTVKDDNDSSNVGYPFTDPTARFMFNISQFNANMQNFRRIRSLSLLHAPTRLQDLTTMLWDLVTMNYPYSFRSLHILESLEVPIKEDKSLFNSDSSKYHSIEFRNISAVNDSFKEAYIPIYNMNGEEIPLFNDALMGTFGTSLPINSSAYETFYYNNKASINMGIAMPVVKDVIETPLNLLKGNASNIGLKGGALQTATSLIANPISQLLRRNAKADDMTRAPNNLKQSGNSVVFDLMADENSLRVYDYSVDTESIDSINKHLERFGYEVNRFDTIDITSRVLWNFLKLNDFDFSQGKDICEDAKQEIRKVLLEGVTFVHTANGITDARNYETLLDAE